MSDSHDEHGFAHPAPVKLLMTVFFALVFLTLATVIISEAVQLGAFEIWVSMGIATVKAALVIFFFMHMLHDKGFNKMMFFASFLFVALFVGITLMDSSQYKPAIDSYAGEKLPDRRVGTDK